MRLLTCTAIAAALVMSTAACTQQESATGNEAASTEAAGDLTALNGTWKTDKASVKFEGKPDDILLQDGTYKCSTCIPPLTVAADGQFHDVAGRAYSDSMSVKAVDDKTVEMKSRKGGRDTFLATMIGLGGRQYADAQVQGFVDAECGGGRRGEHLVAGRSCACRSACGFRPVDPEPGERIFRGRAERDLQDRRQQGDLVGPGPDLHGRDRWPGRPRYGRHWRKHRDGHAGRQQPQGDFLPRRKSRERGRHARFRPTANP